MKALGVCLTLACSAALATAHLAATNASPITIDPMFLEPIEDGPWDNTDVYEPNNVSTRAAGAMPTRKNLRLPRYAATCFDGVDETQIDPNAPKVPQTYLLKAKDLVEARDAYKAGKADAELNSSIKKYREKYVSSAYFSL